MRPSPGTSLRCSSPGAGAADGVPRDHPQAIDHAVENSRDIDYRLVDAQETRRIVDRLYGYPVSEVLWRKVNGGLSAGRVQSPAVRLVVERERERMAFVAADYWDLAAEVPPPTPGLRRHARGRRRSAGGRRAGLRRDGQLKPGDAPRPASSTSVTPSSSRSGADRCDVQVTSVDEKPYRARPAPPFMTSTLQQEAGRKLRLSARHRSCGWPRVSTSGVTSPTCAPTR